jgi:hypothetical protein
VNPKANNDRWDTWDDFVFAELFLKYNQDPKMLGGLLSVAASKLGFHDQREALHYVVNFIRAFEKLGEAGENHGESQRP